MSEIHDHVVVGSGPAGAIAAQRLLELGKRVLLVDVGDDDPALRERIPDLPFEEIRETDPAQRDYFLGPSEEGIPRGKVRVGAHLTPPRQFVRRRADAILPTETKDASIMQSLALGGLGAAWGAGIATYPDSDLRAIGLDPRRIDPAYAEIAARIGASGEPCGMIAKLGAGISPPLALDENAEAILSRFRSGRAREGLELGPYPLAALSRKELGREANPLHDMDFYSESRRSVFRPRYLIEELERNPAFAIRRGLLVVRIRRSAAALEIECVNVGDGARSTIRARKALLAAGAIGSARILMASLDSPAVRATGQPLLANPYRYWVMCNWPRLGGAGTRPRHSLAQLYGLFRDEGSPEVSLSFYSYRSLLLFKLVRELPMP
ncbi:MAG TPA: hypothetical protein VM598_06075, partial [Bdellovibrionota bacterium]|nr:hypothetical protein [Bdellovibrionota bacterium]